MTTKYVLWEKAEGSNASIVSESDDLGQLEAEQVELESVGKLGVVYVITETVDGSEINVHTAEEFQISA